MQPFASTCAGYGEVAMSAGRLGCRYESKEKSRKTGKFLARAVGLEPVTYGLTANPARVKSRRNLRFFKSGFSPYVDLI